MLRYRFASTARSSSGAQGGHLLLAFVLATLAATASFTEALGPRPAAADEIANLKAEAAAISQKLVQEQLEVGADQQQYSVASAKVAEDAAAITRVDRQIQVDQQQIDHATSVVRQQAVLAYMDAGTDLSRTDAALFSSNEWQAQASSEYAAIVAGNLDDALDRLHSDRRTLQTQQATLVSTEAADRAAAATQATALSEADATEQQMQATQSQITGQLAAAVASQQAAENAAAAAAVARAQQAARSAAPPSPPAAAPPSTSGPPATTSGGGGTGAGGVPVYNIPDPPLPPFLQCVVQAESGGNYQAVSPNGLYMGAFQFSQPTWNMAVQAANLPLLVGVPPNLATKAEQDTVAIALYSLDGQQPWLGDRCS